MGTLPLTKEELALRYWKASLAWKNIENWAKGWTQGAFIEELHILCQDNGAIGQQADNLLDAMVRGQEREEIFEGVVVPLQRPSYIASKTKISGQSISA